MNLKFKKIFDTGADNILELDTTLSKEGRAADAKAAGDALSKHNTSVLSHNDIRIALQDLVDQVTSLLNTDDQTLDETREIVAYIKANRTLIDNVTIEKVDVSDIVNNLVSNVTDRPLSAAQGVVLKALIDSNAAALADKLSNSQLTSAINTALAQAKASGEFNGEKGEPGKNGERGTGILKVTTAPSSYTTAIDSYTPKYRIALSTVKSQSGVSEVLIGDIIQYSYYQYTVDHLDSSYAYISATRLSIRGAAGEAGTTPVKGTDYWTSADQESIVQDVIAALGTPVFGTVDENCNINLTGVLADGKTYTFTYTDEDGNIATIGTYTKTNVPKYTNQISTSIDTDGSVYNGTGYIEKRRLNSSGALAELDVPDAPNAVFTTGFIRIKPNDVIRLKNCFMDTIDAEKAAVYGKPTYSLGIRYYQSNFTYMNGAIWTQFADKPFMAKDAVIDSNGICTGFTIKSDATYPYMRMTLAPTGDPSQAIVTINEEIVE